MTTPEERRLVRALSIACHRQRKRNPRFDTWELDTWGPAYRRAVMNHLAILRNLVEPGNKTPELMGIAAHVRWQVEHGELKL